MPKETLKIPNISCGHCVNAIKEELGELEGVNSVEGVPDDKIITIDWNSPATLESIKERLKEINYPAS